MTTSALELTQALVRYDTINPPGNERACAEHLGRLLEAAGFDCSYLPMKGDAGRPSLIARIGGSAAKPPLAFTGHTDVVPLGTRPWTAEPFGAEVKDGKVWGRGTSDMKAGVAALVAAAIDLAPRLEGTPGLLLVITAGEETGCEGAFDLAATPAGREAMGRAGALVVAEPTSNRPLVGHRGALWLEATAHGKTAHGSMPEQGVNAVYKMAWAALALEDFDFNVARHPVLGSPTLNVGWMRGGINVNSVPDKAQIGIDIRTIPAQDHRQIMADLAALLGGEIELRATIDVGGVWTDPAGPWMREVFQASAAVRGGGPSRIEAAPYFTDASALTPALGNVPTVILGPGEAHMAHQTDEYCEIARIEEAKTIYARLIESWCRLE
jgi:succinyl-diaminopimelate desuccinylase